MKKILLSMLAAGSFFATNAQPGMLLYGMGTYSSQRGSETTSFAGTSHTADRPRTIFYNVAPGFGFQLSEHLTLGIEIGYTGSKYSIDKDQAGTSSPFETKNRDLGVGPFARYTQHLGEHFFVYGQFTARYLNGRYTNYYQITPNGSTRSEEDRYNGYNFDLYPAFGIRVARSVALSFGFGGIGYDYRKYDFYAPAGTTYTGKSNNFQVTFGQQFNVGIQKTFGGKRHHMGHHEPMDDTRHMDTKDDEDSDGHKKKHRKDEDE